MTNEHIHLYLPDKDPVYTACGNLAANGAMTTTNTHAIVTCPFCRAAIQAETQYVSDLDEPGKGDKDG